jgi:hypothetical protein
MYGLLWKTLLIYRLSIIFLGKKMNVLIGFTIFFSYYKKVENITENNAFSGHFILKIVMGFCLCTVVEQVVRSTL